MLERLVDKDPTIRGMACSMKNKLDKYWGSINKMNKLLFCAHVLDLRFKLSFIKLAIDRLYPQNLCNEILQSMKNNLSRLFAFYVGLTTSTPNTQSKSSKDFESTNVANISTSCDKGVRLEFKKRKLVSSVHMKNKLEKYLEEAEEDGDNVAFNVLEWWKVNSSKYKILSLLARNVFSIPLSIMASESTFSTRRHILDPYRSSLTAKMVEALICFQNWIRSISLPFDIRVYDDCFQFCQVVEKSI